MWRWCSGSANAAYLDTTGGHDSSNTDETWGRDSTNVDVTNLMWTSKVGCTPNVDRCMIHVAVVLGAFWFCFFGHDSSNTGRDSGNMGRDSSNMRS